MADLGLLHQQLHNYQKAISYFETSVKLNPANARAYDPPLPQQAAWHAAGARQAHRRAEAVQRRVARPQARLKPRLAAEVVGCTRATGRMQ
jgi:tetratricopeptide (TPR) repeat protein